MKILKPGKVERRTFVCTKCGCEFVATEQEKYLAHDDYYQAWMEVQCPCGVPIKWYDGEPYEETEQDKENDAERLRKLIAEGMRIYSDYGGCAEYLIINGVTVMEGMANGDT